MKSRVFKHFFTVLALLLSASAYAYSDTVRSTLIGLSDFREIRPNIYVSPNTNSSHEQAIITLISHARLRITEQFGPPTSTPKIIFLKGKEEEESFKLYQAPGKVLIAPWGNYLILNQTLVNIDVAAHELIHAEIAERLGYLTRMRTMPTWLDEGIALQVDHRARYSNLATIDDTELKRIASLVTPKLFWTQNPEQNIKNYQSSKVAVRQTVLPAIREKGLYAILDKMKNGTKIDAIMEN